MSKRRGTQHLKKPAKPSTTLHALYLLDGNEPGLGGVYSTPAKADAARERAALALFTGYKIEPVDVDEDLFVPVVINKLTPVDETEEFGPNDPGPVPDGF